MNLLVMAIGSASVLAASRPDTAQLTQLRLVVDSATWAGMKDSEFLPEAFGAGFLAGPAEVRLCARLSCIVMVPADSARGEYPGDIVVGVRPTRGSALADRLAGVSAPRARVAIVEPPPPPAFDQEELPLVYYLERVTLAVPEESMPRLELWLRSAGASVFREGEGIVVEFGSQTLRLRPGWAGPGPEQISFYLRREHPGNPTYKFGGRSRLRFGPGRKATWTF